MREKLVKIGAKVVSHTRYVIFQIVELVVLIYRKIAVGKNFLYNSIGAFVELLKS